MKEHVTKTDYFLAYTNIILHEALSGIEEFNTLEKQSIRLSVYRIFEESLTLEETYYKLLDYFDDQKPELNCLIPKIEIFFNTQLNN